jgi:hypothetical protein
MLKLAKKQFRALLLEMLDKRDMVKYNKIKSIPVVSAFTQEKSNL